ncbi:DNA-binding protein [Larkinella harenae]
MRTLSGLFLLFLLILLAGSVKAQGNKSASPKRYVKVPAGYLMVLRQGDDVFAQLESLAQTEKIPSANFTGMGFVNVTFGYFDQKTKEYNPRKFEDVELASLTGSIAWQDQKPSLHIHGVVTDRSFQAYGGHMLSATVGTGSVEILITIHDKPLQRVKEEPLGANVLQLGQ